MLDHEELLEAQPIGFGYIVDEALVALAVFQADTALGARASEQAKLHARFPGTVIDGPCCAQPVSLRNLFRGDRVSCRGLRELRPAARRDRQGGRPAALDQLPEGVAARGN